MQKFAVENALTMVLAFVPAFNVMSPKVKNYKGGLLNRPKFHEVWLA